MAKTPKATPKGRASNPLGGVTKKPASYVGDLDDLLGQVADDPEPTPEAQRPTRQGRGEATPRKRKAAKEEMKIASSEDDVPRSRINLLLPADLHRQFKVRAATDGITMTSVLEAYIREYVAS